MGADTFRILLVDDHQMLIDGLARILEGEANIGEVLKVNSGADALRVLQSQTIDLLVSDMEMPNMNGLELVTKAKEMRPSLKVLIISMYGDKQLIQKMMKLGADGYVLKSSSEEEIILAVAQILMGRKYFSSDISQTLISENQANLAPGSHHLSEREVEVLQLIAEGHSTKAIARDLHISNRTVDNHRANMLKKVEAKNIAALIRYGIKNGLID